MNVLPRGEPSSPLPALEVQGLTRHFPVGKSGRTVTAVNQVSFRIQQGEVLGLVGESGSGKSTIARLIAGLYTPSSGQIQLSGQTLPPRLSSQGMQRFRKQVQMIFQDPYASLNPQQKVSYILSRPFQIHGLARGRQVRTEVAGLLERVGLSPGHLYAEKRPHELSGGQRQRVSIARALAVRPSVILADEPTSALDVSIRLDIMNLLLDLRDQEGLSMLFITHDLAGARYMCDRVAVMYAGHIVEMGPADEVIQRPRHPYTQLLKEAAPNPEAQLKTGKVDARGEIPDLKNLPAGCPFAPRCPHVQKACQDRVPEMYRVGSEHQSRCILHDPTLAR